jgi:hypothetical protein
LSLAEASHFARFTITTLRGEITMISWNRYAKFSVAGAMVFSALAVLMLASTPARGDDETGNPEPQQQVIPTQPQDESISLQGTGRQATQKFELQPGLSVFEVAHEGQSNLIIKLLDENGKEIDTVFNQIGPFVGQRGLHVPQGASYLLDVVADGDWAVDVRQPRPAAGQSSPIHLEGQGSRATPFVQLDKGLVVFKMKHDGEDRFRVTLLDKDGNPIESLINTLGQFDGSKPLSIEEPGIYFLNVSGDGDWSIDVE